MKIPDYYGVKHSYELIAAWCVLGIAFFLGSNFIVGAACCAAAVVTFYLDEPS